MFRFIVVIGFILCAVFLIYEVFLVQDNLMNWMVATMRSGDVKYEELFQKAHLLVLIPAIVTLEKMRKRLEKKSSIAVTANFFMVFLAARAANRSPKMTFTVTNLFHVSCSL